MRLTESLIKDSKNKKEKEALVDWRVPMTILETIEKEIKFYQEKINEYREGNIDPNIRAIRAVMGVYPERQEEKYMTRIKTPAGILTLEQFEAISKIADKYSRGEIHLTTRQDIQFQGVELENTVKIMEEALDLGINTLGAGGNTARNVACSPLSGVDKDEVFDVTPHALATAEHLLHDPSTRKLPRKYKISFSNSNVDTAYATIADLGFIAKIQDDQRGFEVYAAGGLGGSPRVSIKIKDFVEEKDTLYYVQAMKELFEAEGDWKNRNRARIRYILLRLGEEKFKELLNYYVEKAKKDYELDLKITDQAKSYIEEESKPLEESPIVIEQKQRGYYSIFVHTENGYLKTKDLYKIIDYLKALGYDISIRLSNTQGFYLRDLKGKDVDGLVKIIKEFTTDPFLPIIKSCVGERVCGTGLCNSKGLSSAIYNRFSREKDEIKKLLPKICISGCANSCGQHQLAQLGFSGRAIKGVNGMIPAYRVFFGGHIGVGKTRLAENKGDIPAKRIPDFIYRLVLLAKESAYRDFDSFIEEKWSSVEELIKDFQLIEEDSDLYFDYDASTRFLTKK